jgi:hypothetical protein
MEKTMNKSANLVENFYQDSLFTFKSNCCFSAIDKINISPQEIRNIIKVESLSSKPIKFAFQPKDGLVRIDEKTGAVVEENILSSLISIDDSQIENYKKFFERNGFLFPIRSDKFEQIDDEMLIRLIDKMKCTVQLISQISEVEKKDYKKILSLTLSLLLSNPFQIEIGDTVYKSCDHKILHDEFIVANNLPKGEYFNTDKDWMFEVNDSIYGKSKIHIDEYRHYVTDPEIGDLERSIMHSFVNHQKAPKKERLLIEFLYHVYFDIGSFHGVTPDEILFNVGFKSNGPIPNWAALDDKLKKALLEVAKIVVSEEINSNIGGVHPEYDSNLMEPRWKVDSLLSALYFSIFYMRPNIEITRLCANPKCSRYFTVSRTSSKKKYCSNECCNRALQNRYRAKHK